MQKEPPVKRARKEPSQSNAVQDVSIVTVSDAYTDNEMEHEADEVENNVRISDFFHS